MTTIDVRTKLVRPWHGRGNVDHMSTQTADMTRSVRLRADAWETLDGIAENEYRTTPWLLRKIVDEYIAARAAAYEAAHEAGIDPTDEAHRAAIAQAARIISSAAAAG